MRASAISRTETRPTAAFFSFGSCEGCQLQALSVEDVLL
jgi:tRNA/tmRNA/rRNA uracil-C5-methylase (TrmA/RlmC/RlmD family)